MAEYEASALADRVREMRNLMLREQARIFSYRKTTKTRQPERCTTPCISWGSRDENEKSWQKMNDWLFRKL